MSTEIIVNAAAGLLRQRPLIASELQDIARGRARLHLTRDLAELDQVADGVCSRRPERVVLVGGDGTLMAGVTALHRSYAGSPLPDLVVAPAGTVATVARNWGVVDSAPRILARSLTGIDLCRVRRPSLLVEQPDGSKRVGFIFGTGLVARFFERYYASGGGGYWTAGMMASRLFLGSLLGDSLSKSVLSPLPCRLEVDGRPLTAPAFSLIVSSVVRDLGLRLRVTYRAGERSDRLHLVASTLNARELGSELGRALAGKPLSESGGTDQLASRFEVSFDRGAEGAYVLDGDLLRSHRVAVSAGPELVVLS